jgi:hypothetical protein
MLGDRYRLTEWYCYGAKLLELSGGEGAAAISLSGRIGRRPGWLVSMTTASGPFSSR